MHDLKNTDCSLGYGYVDIDLLMSSITGALLRNTVQYRCFLGVRFLDNNSAMAIHQVPLLVVSISSFALSASASSTGDVSCASSHGVSTTNIAVGPNRESPLTTPKLRVDASGVDQLAVRAALRDLATLQDYDFVAIENCPQPMCDEHTRSGFLFKNAVDVLQQCLLCVGVQC